MPKVPISDEMNVLAAKTFRAAGIDCDVQTGLDSHELALIALDSEISDDVIEVIAALPQVKQINRLRFQ